MMKRIKIIKRRRRVSERECCLEGEREREKGWRCTFLSDGSPGGRCDNARPSQSVQAESPRVLPLHPLQSDVPRPPPAPPPVSSFSHSPPPSSPPASPPPTRPLHPPHIHRQTTIKERHTQTDGRTDRQTRTDGQSINHSIGQSVNHTDNRSIIVNYH